MQRSGRTAKSLSTKARVFLRQYSSELGWGVVGVAVLLSLVLGVVGFEKNLSINDPDHRYSVVTRAFMVLQMITLNEGSIPEPIGWQLQASRALALFAFSTAVLKTAAVYFRKQWLPIRLRLLRNQVVIASDTTDRSLLISNLIDEGETVVVVTENVESAAALELQDHGAFVLRGDASTVKSLRQAGIHRAAKMIVLGPNDADNVQVAAAVTMQRQNGVATSKPFAIFLQCSDPRMFSLLEKSVENDSLNTQVHFERFDLNHNIARRLLDVCPLDQEPITKDSDTIVRLVLLGHSAETEALLIQSAKLSHFANGKPPEVFLVDPEASFHFQRLQFRYPQIDKLCILASIDGDLESTAVMDHVTDWVLSDDRQTTLVIAPVDEDLALRVALALPSQVSMSGVPTIVRTNHRDGLTRLVSLQDPPPWIPFGSQEESETTSMILKSELDAMAKHIHADYVGRRLKEGAKVDQYPALRPWPHLNESYREANRHQADHIWVKLRAVQCVAVKKGELGTQRPAQWSADEIETLARMEHARWNANRYLEGWQVGPRDDSQKRHPNLVPWDELDEPTKDYDRNAVRQIPELLALLGRVIVRTGGEASL